MTRLEQPLEVLQQQGVEVGRRRRIVAMSAAQDTNRSAAFV
jgi:hypothetical protein